MSHFLEKRKINLIVLNSVVNEIGKHKIDLDDNDLKSIYYKIIRNKDFIKNRSMSVPRLNRDKGFSFFMKGTNIPNIYIIGGYSISPLELEIADRINKITKLVGQSRLTTKACYRTAHIYYLYSDYNTSTSNRTCIFKELAKTY